jgi:peptide/nickel transport system permease protein
VQQFILRRILLSIPTVIIVTFIVFAMVRIDPDALPTAILGESYTPDAAEIIKDRYGLNNPWHTEYFRWMGNIMQGDWGRSAYTSRPVLDEMAPKIAVTLELALLAVFFSVLIGIPIGVFSAMRQDAWPDYILRGLTVFGLAVPGFYIATLTLAFLANQLGWIPSIRYTSLREDPLTNLSQMWLPAFILAIATAATAMRYSRTMMLDVLRQDYIRTAWAKGLRERSVVVRHGLKNAMLPVITVVGLSMAFLVGGTVIFESLFSLPGLGTHLIRAAQQRDFAVIQGITLFLALATIAINLIVDLTYVVLDPRART